MKDIKKYTDQRGYLGHIDSNGNLEFGDSSARTSFKEIANYLSGKPASKIYIMHLISRLRLNSGEYTRHWNGAMWSGKPGTMSRDNFLPLVVLMGFFDCKALLKSSLWTLIKRGFFLWNTKAIGQQNDNWKIPDHGGFTLLIAYLRSFKSRFSYPILLLVDLVLLLNVIIRVIISRIDSDNVGDDLNLTLLLIQGSEIMPTPLLTLAKYIYKKFRLKAYVKCYGHPIHTAFAWYFRHDGAPPIDVLYYPLIKKYFKL